MRTNIDLDDALMAEAFRSTPVKTKKELIHLALIELIASRRRRDMRDLKGSAGIRSDYDYKVMRERGSVR